MPTTNICFTEQHSSTQRQKTIHDMQNWIINAQQNISPFKRKILQTTLNYASQEKFVHINRVTNLLVDRAEFRIFQPILAHADRCDIDLKTVVLNALATINNNSSDLKNALKNVITVDFPLPHQPSAQPLLPEQIVVWITPESLDTKLKEFQASLADLQKKDGEKISTELLLTFVVGISSAIDIRIALLMTLFCCVPIFLLNQQGRENRNNAKQLEQKKLQELLGIYKSLTPNGNSDTYNPLVLKLLRIIAPYVVTKELWHWRDFSISTSCSARNDVPHPDFLKILALPPHQVTFTSQRANESTEEMRDRLEMKTHLNQARYGFWNRAFSELYRETYGLSATNVATQHCP
jgi:hypothetical protein